ncbi:MAG: hypothetical protein AAFW84_07355 [Cyanobacteria bacterium J06635_15]
MEKNNIAAIVIVVVLGFVSTTLGLALILKPSPQVVAHPQTEATEEPQAPAASTPAVDTED